MILRCYYSPKLDLSNMPRPRAMVDWSDRLCWYFAAEFATPGNDPVWMVEWDWTFTEAEAKGWRGKVVDALARWTP